MISIGFQFNFELYSKKQSKKHKMIGFVLDLFGCFLDVFWIVLGFFWYFLDFFGICFFDFFGFHLDFRN